MQLEYCAVCLIAFVIWNEKKAKDIRRDIFIDKKLTVGEPVKAVHEYAPAFRTPAWSITFGRTVKLGIFTVNGAHPRQLRCSANKRRAWC